MDNEILKITEKKLEHIKVFLRKYMNTKMDLLADDVMLADYDAGYLFCDTDYVNI
ncbi:MAG: hypothetical protein PF450_04195 [Bacteroidales bacterium]|jgi:hypothetical protein|nr:hypothetical protein [Bacteroidales bacterium]